MIDTIDQVTAFSLISFITKGMTIQAVNSQEVHIQESMTEVFDMLGCMILYLKVIQEDKHMLLHSFEEYLLPELQNSMLILNQQFKMHGQAFRFQLSGFNQHPYSNWIYIIQSLIIKVSQPLKCL